MRRAIDYGPPTIGGKVNILDLSRTDPKSMNLPAWLRQEMLIGTHNEQAAREAAEEEQRQKEEQAKRDALRAAGGGAPGGAAPDLDQAPHPFPGGAPYPARQGPYPGGAQYPARQIEAPVPYFGDYFGEHAQDQFRRPQVTVADNQGPRPWSGG